MTETIFRKNEVYLEIFNLVKVQPEVTEEEGFMTYTAAHHQCMIESF